LPELLLGATIVVGMAGCFVSGVLVARPKIRRDLHRMMAEQLNSNCAKCGYDLADLPPGFCPECGHPFGPIEQGRADTVADKAI